MQSSDSSKREYVLDAGAFYSGVPFQSSSDYAFYTTDQVFDEIRHIKSSFAAIDTLIHVGNLRIMDPDKEFVEKVAEAARSTGDIAKLSSADISILALALQLKIPLISGDYAVSNVAPLIGVKIKSAGNNQGIREIRKYVTYCSACGKAYGPEAKECQLCGNRLKRRWRKKKVKDNQAALTKD